jgi:hypothetical protein
MFEDYLQDSYDFLLIASNLAGKSEAREARRYYRASVFYASGAIEAFLNYVADSFAKAESLSPHEICFLNDKVLTFSVDRGLKEKVQHHRLEDKIRLLMHKFVSGFDFKSPTWSKFLEFKSFRDGLVHPRQVEDDTPLTEYDRQVKTGLGAVIEIMSQISTDVFGRPLRKQLLDLIPE